MGDVLLKLHQVLDCATRTLCYGLFREFRAQGSSFFWTKTERSYFEKQWNQMDVFLRNADVHHC